MEAKVITDFLTVFTEQLDKLVPDPDTRGAMHERMLRERVPDTIQSIRDLNLEDPDSAREGIILTTQLVMELLTAAILMMLLANADQKSWTMAVNQVNERALDDVLDPEGEVH